MIIRTTRFLLIASWLLAPAGQALGQPPAQSFPESRLTQLEELGRLYARASVARFYREAGFTRVWDETQLADLRTAIDQSASHGLTARFYHRDRLAPDAEGVDGVERDILATDAYLALAGHLLGGVLNPVSMEPTWTAKGREKDLVAYLKQALQADPTTAGVTGHPMAASLEALAPHQPRYRQLRETLAHYRDVAKAGGWQQVDAGDLIKPGMQNLRVGQVRRRLEATGDVKPLEAEAGATGANGPTPRVDDYDPGLVAAVKTFQRRANLEPDGIVGPATVRKLNRSPQDRIDQLRVNLERWRWLPEDLGQKHIRVNIADYQLEAHEGDDVSEIHDVVVGKPFRQTPVFSAVMSYVVLNPWWETPSSLARKDILPKFQKDPGTVESFGYQVLDGSGSVVSPQSINWNKYTESNFPFRLRQKPGPKNALGQVKFMFPNQHNVYLHDTPSRDLFAKTRRDFSSGCIRVKDPVDLAEWVLAGNPDWTRARIDQVLESGKETSVTLNARLPVHLLYWTVVADDETGGVRFIEDIYDRDTRVLEALNLPASER